MKHIKVTERQVNDLYHAAVDVLHYFDGSDSFVIDELSEAISDINGGICRASDYLLLDTVVKEGDK